MNEGLSNILNVMKEKKVSNTQLQKELGLYASAVSEWKNGSSESYMKHLPRIAEYLGVSTEYLLGNTDIRTLLLYGVRYMCKRKYTLNRNWSRVYLF